MDASNLAGFETADYEKNRNKGKESNKPEIKSELILCNRSRIYLPEDPRPDFYGMGEKTWEHQARKLDALFAIYILGWAAIKMSSSDLRSFIKPEGDKWYPDMLPFIHDDSRYINQGVENLRLKNIFINIESSKDGYKVSIKNQNILVIDDDLNFAQMAASLLACNIKHDVIQYAWNHQEDYTTRYKRRLKEKTDEIRRK